MELSTLPDELISVLSGDPKLEYAEFIREYPGKEALFIKRKSLVAVGISAFEVSRAGISGYLGSFGGGGSKDEFFGRKLSVRYVLTVFCPQAEGGECCTKAFFDISSALLNSPAGLQVNSITAGGVEYNPKLDTHTLKITLAADYYIANAPDWQEPVSAVSVIKI